jgi:hypothetical protein
MKCGLFIAKFGSPYDPSIYTAVVQKAGVDACTLTFTSITSEAICSLPLLKSTDTIPEYISVDYVLIVKKTVGGAIALRKEFTRMYKVKSLAGAMMLY